jgi:hypothetical protein
MESAESQSTRDRDSISEFALDFSETTQIPFSGGSVSDTLANVVEPSFAAAGGWTIDPVQYEAISRKSGMSCWVKSP